jgi:hypothetical protein
VVSGLEGPKGLAIVRRYFRHREEGGATSSGARFRQQCVTLA